MTVGLLSKERWEVRLWKWLFGKSSSFILLGCLLLVAGLTGCGGGGGGDSSGGGNPTPTVEILPRGGAVVTGSVVLVEMKTQPGSTIKINDQFMRGNAGTFTLSVSLRLGINVLAVGLETPTGAKQNFTHLLQREYPKLVSGRDVGDGRRHIFMIDGTQARRVGPLSASGMVQDHPVFSPDGQSVFATSSGPLGWSLVRYHLRNGSEEEDQEELLYGPDAQASLIGFLQVDREGTKLLFLRQEGAESTWHQLNLTTKITSMVLQETGITRPVFDPSGDFIFFLKTELGNISLMRKRITGNFPSVAMAGFPGEGQMVCSLGNSLVMISTEADDPGEVIPVPEWRLRYFRYSDQQVLADRTFTINENITFGCHRSENTVFSGVGSPSINWTVSDLNDVTQPGLGGLYSINFRGNGSLYTDPRNLSF